MKYLPQLIISLTVLIVGTILGVVVEKYRSSEEGTMRYLDLSIEDTRALFSTPELLGRKVEVRLDDKPIKNISQIAIKIYNRSDRDFDAVPIYVELLPDGQSPVDVVSDVARGAGDLPESVARISDVAGSQKPGGVRFGYRLQTANRSDAFEPVFSATYFLLGSEPPRVNVVIDKKGLALKRFTYSPRFGNAFLEIATLMMTDSKWWAFVAVYGGVVYLYIAYQKRDRAKRRTRTEARIESILAAKDPSEVFGLASDRDPREVAERLVALVLNDVPVKEDPKNVFKREDRQDGV